MGKRKASKKITKTGKPKSRRVSSKVKVSNKTISKIAERNTSHIAWKKKYTSLQSLVDKQARDLKLQSRELEIEAALEHVRARTIAMQTSGELQEASYLLFKQLKALGIPVWSCGYNIWEPGDEVCTGWMSSVGMLQPPFKIPLNESPTFIRFKKSKEKGEAFYVEEVKGKALADHYKYMLTLPDFAAIMKKRFDTGFTLPKSQFNHVVNFRHGNLIFITSVPVPECYDVFRRFAVVFEQTFTRFLDLQKAEAQTREAQIESALERVRSKTMAMHNSHDVGDTVAAMVAELAQLGVGTNRCGILIFVDEQTAEVWTARPNPDGKAVLIIGRLNMSIHNLLSSVQRAWKSNSPTYQYDLFGDDIVAYYDAINQAQFYPVQFDLTKLPSKEYHTDFFFGEGAVFAFTAEPLPDEHSQIFKRFAGVFGQTYRRYLDLQKAEGQAREARIEMALEKVRSKSLAMHKSEELKEVVFAVFECLRDLNIPTDTTNILIFRDETKDVDIWVANEMNYANLFRTPYSVKMFPPDFREARERQELFYRTFDFEEKNEAWKELFENSDFRHVPEQRKKYLLETECFVQLIASCRETGIMLCKYKLDVPFTEADGLLLARFSKVLAQAYTRFLDLQKAEAQARESQIQLALERVRARTMAMQKSDQLREVTNELYVQLKSLGFSIGVASIIIMDPSTGDMDWWMEGSEDGYRLPERYHVPFFNHKSHVEQLEHWKNGSLYAVVEVSGAYKKTFDQYYFFETDFIHAPEESKQLMMSQESASFAMAYMAYGALSWSPALISNEQADVLMRFAKVFEQTYTRFLDLQKAEAQARESQIQLALERVRARTMAMQRSEELGEVASTMFHQIKGMGIKLWGAIIDIWQPGDAAALEWASTPDGKFLPPFKNPIHYEDQVVKDALLARENGNEIFEFSLNREQTSEGYKRLASQDETSEIFKSGTLGGFKFPDTEVHYITFFPDGFLHFIALEPSPESRDLFKRVTKVFAQAYTRFLDLQKAEELARESQIQLALERVRARTMAMHKSDELLEVIIVVSEQLQQLNIKFGNVSFGVNSPAYDMQLWMAVKGFPKAYLIKWTFLDNPGVTRLKEAQRNPARVYSDVLSQTENNEWMQHIFNCNPSLDIFTEENKQALLNTPGFARSIVIMKDIFLVVGNYAVIPYSDEANTIFKRFANVFEQAYTRFLDLQKAEAQAREAQIEAGLERVRASSMAMHHSNDLKEVIKIVSEQLQQLGIEFEFTNFILVRDDGHLDTWIWAPAQPYATMIEIPKHDDLIFNAILNAKRAGDDFLRLNVGRDDKNAFMRNFFEKSIARATPEERKQYIYSKPSFTASFAINKILLCIANYDERIYSEEEDGVLRRFGTVFDQAYTRYLDLQKAEAQAREAQIEAGLERVRARAMAMHQSDDVHEVIKVVTEQLVALGLQFHTTSFLKDHPDGSWDVWISNPGQTYPNRIHVPYLNHPIFNTVIEARERNLEFVTMNMNIEEKNAFFHHFFENTEARDIPEERKQFVFSIKGYALSTFATKNIWMSVGNYDGAPFADETNSVLKRFAGVFEQAYTRFLDLQKAEAQAREAQIEAALEKIRSRSLAMHHSNELKEVIAIFFERLNDLNVLLGTVGIQLFDQKTLNSYLWVSNAIQDPQMVNLPHDEELMRGDNFLRDMWQARTEGVDIINKEYSHEQKDIFFNYVFSNNDYSQVPENARKVLRSLKKHIVCLIMEKNSALLVDSFTGESFSDEQVKVLRRGAKVFEQAYIRFLDLQKAEAQTMEARIEAALERVRARAMAMHNSADLKEVVHELRKQMGMLGQSDLNTCVIHLHDESPDYIQAWAAMRSPGSDGEFYQQNINVPKKGLKIIEEALQAYDEKRGNYVLAIGGEKFRQWTSFMQQNSPATVEKFFETAKGTASNDINGYWSFADFLGGSLLTVTVEPPDDTTRLLLQRFANVFGLAYRRFADLKRAEAQAREAQIEAALERVRGKAMAMHNSNDLAATASLVFGELRKLGISPLRCGVGLIDRETRKTLLYSATSSDEGDALSIMGWVMLTGHPVLTEIFETWTRNEDYFPELNGEQLKSYYEQLVQGLNVPVAEYKYDRRQFGHFMPFSIGCLYAWSETRYSDTDVKILKRFAAIIDLTFRRYVELQKSEANAREAVKQAALDRIRADIASMRTVADLDRITPLIWNELTTLGVPFIRCGVFIMDHSQRQIHTFLSTPDGKAIAAFNIPFDVPGKIGEAFRHWQTQTAYVGHWDKTEFTTLADILVNQGSIANREQYFSTLPADGFWLHFLPFLQGILYVGNMEKLGDEDIDLVQSVASAFSTAYARYEDFNKLESAKTQVEHTLSELKQTQQQLIQSEKMASLGELTAGIAHEIQNPLNFVNNFSELNKELLAEMSGEIEKGNYDEAKAIAKAISENQEKINNHGKRADEIVKGMLQHSRTSSGQKELTDLNVLVDEYIRLAYHGLRAKDKSFNAKFEINLDPSLPKLKVVSQDIGRVILNLINNAFYAVNEKKKAQTEGYEPTVVASTRRTNGITEISVRDNGNGIHESIREKIFQPFFTTKPTGQGTGLGLSLAYDIVKAHAGEIRVQTEQGKGTEFIIQLMTTHE